MIDQKSAYDKAIFGLVLIVAVLAFGLVVQVFLYAERLQVSDENKARIERAKGE